MSILTYAIAVLVILALCVVGLSIGLLLRGKGLRTCGRAAEDAGQEHDIECAACSGRSADCKRRS